MSQNRKTITDQFEETLIALILGMMTLITFANVIARYVFNSNILWALEVTVFLFAWLVLLGSAYAVKTSAHLGVDVILNLLSPAGRRIMGLIATLACVLFTLLLLKGAWDYWANFANLPQTTGKWLPTGFEEKFRGRGWFETQDTPMPEWLRFIEPIFNEGFEYEKIPRFIPYAVLPLSMALLLYRFLQAGWRIWQGSISALIVSHEAEDDIDAAAEAAAAGDVR